MRARTLLWDLDGTLVAWKGLRVFVETTLRHWCFLARHLPPLRAAWHSMRAYQALYFNRTDRTHAEVYLERFARGMGVEVERIRALEAEFFATGIEPLRTLIEPIVPVRDLFHRLAATGRYRMAAVTNPSMPVAFGRARLGWAGYDPDRFVLVTGTETSTRMKTDPRFYVELLAALGARPEECVMIGNDGRKDLTAAHLGIPVFLVDAGHLVAAGRARGLAGVRVGGVAELEAWLATPA